MKLHVRNFFKEIEKRQIFNSNYILKKKNKKNFKNWVITKLIKPQPKGPKSNKIVYLISNLKFKAPITYVYKKNNMKLKFNKANYNKNNFF